MILGAVHFFPILDEHHGMGCLPYDGKQEKLPHKPVGYRMVYNILLGVWQQAQCTSLVDR